jgi:isochorismate synthase
VNICRVPLSAARLDPLALLTLPAFESTLGRFAWLSPEGRGRAVVGVGIARQRQGWPLVSGDLVGAGDAPWFVTCPFSADAAASPSAAWSEFHPPTALFPEVMLTVDDDGAWLNVAGPSDESTLLDDARELAAALAAAEDVPPEPAPRSLHAGSPFAPAEADVLHARVTAALAAIASGEVQKVVVATAHTTQLAQPADPVALLRRLRSAQPGCFLYLVEPVPGKAFLGATPERLVAVSGSQARTMALAGSARRGQNAADDSALGASLLDSAKDRAEHQLVVDELRVVLAPMASEMDVPDAPRLKQLATIQHLETPITATLPAQGDVLDLAGRLHPTPALAGTPREAALAVIHELEGNARGWYGGLVGWADAAGNGDLSVAIRCLLLDGDSATAFAGAGIVAGSDPEREVAEIGLKLGVALGALGGG